LGWDCTLKTCDGHQILIDNKKTNNYGSIEVGNHCWLCSKSSILKNGFLGDNCILAYGSFLNKKISDKAHLLYAGQPARIVKENVNWEK
jgi:acetyltransferase-like isoleucine patch superfamily enzyme